MNKFLNLSNYTYQIVFGVSQLRENAKIKQKACFSVLVIVEHFNAFVGLMLGAFGLDGWWTL